MRRTQLEIWKDKFKPEMDDEGIRLYETYDTDRLKIEAVKNKQGIKHIWTIIQDGNNLYITPGMHLVNRINYLVTKIPWEDINKTYKYG